jgi:hypothetical protein
MAPHQVSDRSRVFQKGYVDGPVSRCPSEERLPRPLARAGAAKSAARALARCEAPMMAFLRKEVIQPQVPLRLPCYDFTPVAELTVAGCPLVRGRRTVFG